jgi:hypothetical protein
MSQWIDFSAIWKVVVFGLLAGAGLPALFAIGVTALSRPGSRRAATAAGPGGGDDVLVGGSVTGIIIAAVCFLIVLAAIGWGIYEIYQTGHPAKK